MKLLRFFTRMFLKLFALPLMVLWMPLTALGIVIGGISWIFWDDYVAEKVIEHFVDLPNKYLDFIDRFE